MPLRGRSDTEAQRIKGVNLFDDPTEVEFGQFTALTNWISRELYTISKKRGVALVPTGAQLPISACSQPGESIMCGLDSIFACGFSLGCIVDGNSILTCLGDSLVTTGTDLITCT